MNNMSLVQLIEWNRRAAGYPPSHVRLPDTRRKTINKIDESEILALLQKWKTQMEKGEMKSGD